MKNKIVYLDQALKVRSEVEVLYGLINEKKIQLDSLYELIDHEQIERILGNKSIVTFEFVKNNRTAFPDQVVDEVSYYMEDGKKDGFVHFYYVNDEVYIWFYEYDGIYEHSVEMGDTNCHLKKDYKKFIAKFYIFLLENGIIER